MYFPQSKIQQNQYTPGTEFQRKDNGLPYTGTYCILSDGRFFTEATLLKTSIELIKIEKNNNSQSHTIFLPNQLTSRISFLNQLKNQQELRPTIIIPSQQDYQNGSMQRYLARKLSASNIQIFEINKQDHDDVINKVDKYLPIYNVTSLSWKITGPNYDNYDNSLNPTYGIMDTNRRTLEIKEKEFVGIKKYFEGRLNEFAK